MLAAAPLGIAAESTIEGITAVSSKAFNGYTRTRLPDGSFKPETYAFGNGGFVTAAPPG